MIARSKKIENASLAVEEAFSKLEEIINENPGQPWMLDISGISTVSSIAIARLIAIVRRIDINGGNIAMINVHPFVSSVLTTMRIVKVLSLFDSKEEAKIFLASAGS
ncbi:MAG: STAS domain-containing protein [Planctomycetes bacterium]|nr:STAS domain-containing protein [Planctomycetota bacterium]